jgi:hypothetical protein
MISFINKYKITLIFIIIGAIGGYLYWYFIGCDSGSCAITSKWHNTAIYGSIFGYLIGDSINPATRKKQNKDQVESVPKNENENEKK